MNAAVRPTLLFNWESQRARARAVVIFVIASLVFHIVCLYLFQIVYPPNLLQTPPPAHVTFITDTSEEGRALLRWIEAEDPALASETQRPPEARTRLIPRLDHIPSYMHRKPVLREAPAPTVDLRAPSALPPAPVPAPNPPTEATPEIFATNVQFSEEFDLFGAARFPDTKFTASSAEQPENVRFRVAINAEGEVRYTFRENSSGDAALDEQARQYMALIRFPASKTIGDGLVWGIATVTWGNDIARPTGSATPAP